MPFVKLKYEIAHKFNYNIGYLQQRQIDVKELEKILDGFKDMFNILTDITKVKQTVNFGIKVETLKTFLKANKIKTKRKSFFSDNDPKTGTELASRADGATIHLQCWNTMAALKEIANTNQVRNLLVSIE